MSRGDPLSSACKSLCLCCDGPAPGSLGPGPPAGCPLSQGQSGSLEHIMGDTALTGVGAGALLRRETPQSLKVLSTPQPREAPPSAGDGQQGLLGPQVTRGHQAGETRPTGLGLGPGGVGACRRMCGPRPARTAGNAGSRAPPALRLLPGSPSSRLAVLSVKGVVPGPLRTGAAASSRHRPRAPPARRPRNTGRTHVSSRLRSEMLRAGRRERRGGFPGSGGWRPDAGAPAATFSA